MWKRPEDGVNIVKQEEMVVLEIFLGVVEAEGRFSRSKEKDRDFTALSNVRSTTTTCLNI